MYYIIILFFDVEASLFGSYEDADHIGTVGCRWVSVIPTQYFINWPSVPEISRSMGSPSRARCSMIILFSQLLLVAHCKPQVPCFFIFGDSLVDNGNNNNRRTVIKANFPPYGIDFPEGPTGRFTNGRNKVDIIAELLGFDEYIPPYVDVAEDGDVLLGVNYGSSGAGILDETGKDYGDVISLNEQLSNHEATVSRIEEMLGDKQKAQELLGSCIYSVGMGSNDYLLNYLPKFYASTSRFTPPEYASVLMSNYSGQLQRLYEAGARKVAVSGVGGLGCTPKEIALHGTSAGSTCVQAIGSITAPFNEELEILIGDLNSRFPDAKFVDTASVRNSSHGRGRISVLDRPCCKLDVAGGCLAGSTPCRNRDEYMFWDEVHPTEAANLISAGASYRAMAPLYSAPVQAL